MIRQKKEKKAKGTQKNVGEHSQIQNEKSSCLTTIASLGMFLFREKTFSLLLLNFVANSGSLRESWSAVREKKRGEYNLSRKYLHNKIESARKNWTKVVLKSEENVLGISWGNSAEKKLQKSHDWRKKNSFDKLKVYSIWWSRPQTLFPIRRYSSAIHIIHTQAMLGSMKAYHVDKNHNRSSAVRD